MGSKQWGGARRGAGGREYMGASAAVFVALHVVGRALARSFWQDTAEGGMAAVIHGMALAYMGAEGLWRRSVNCARARRS